MNRKGFFQTLGILGAGVITSKVISKIKDEPDDIVKIPETDNTGTGWARYLQEQFTKKSSHRNDANVWFNAGDEARAKNMADEMWNIGKKQIKQFKRKKQ